MKDWKSKPNLKRNALIAAIMVFIGAAAYLNWSYNQRWGEADSAMAQAEDRMTQTVNAILSPEGSREEAVTASVSGYFSQARLTRQQSRDQALSLLETAASAQSASRDTIDAAMEEITNMANLSLLETKIENELLAKSFADCVVFMTEDNCTVAVPAGADGLTEAEVSRITDAVTANSDYTPSDINIIQVLG